MTIIHGTSRLLRVDAGVFSLLCAMKYATFLFYDGWILITTAFVAALKTEMRVFW
jgi:hypothetical protein